MKVFIIGATSSIAYETAKLFATQGAHLYLAARDKEKLDVLEHDLLVRGAEQVDGMALDLCIHDHHQKLVDSAVRTLDGIDIVLIAHGTLGDQKRCEKSVTETFKELSTNCLSIISLLTILANYFEKRQKGCIAVISSVAGDRGRQSNYVYGTAKGAVSIFLQGLRNRLSGMGVQVITIKPGFVDTPMTANVRKNALFADPKDIGKQIFRAINTHQDVVYAPYFWRPIMACLKLVPEKVFKTMKL